MVLDKQRTVWASKSLLGQYRRSYMIAGREYKQRLTPSYSDMPKGQPVGNMLEEYIAEKVDALRVIEGIEEAFQVMPEHYVELLRYVYTNDKRLTAKEIASILMMSRNKYYSELDTALEYFAYSYQNGKLLKYKKG